MAKKKKAKVYPPRKPGSPPRRLENSAYRDVEWLLEEQVKDLQKAEPKSDGTASETRP